MGLFDSLGGLELPGFAGGQFQLGQGMPVPVPQPPMMDPIKEALAKNALMPKPQGGGFMKEGGTFRNILGAIGDALLVHSGHAPIYAPHMQQKRLGQALANYLGNLEPGLAEIMQRNPEVGLSLYKMQHPSQGVELEIVREMKAAGIDPASDEGRTIIKGHLARQGAGAGSAFGRDLSELGIDPKSDEARELYYGRNSPAGYLMKPPKRGQQPAGGGLSDSIPTVNSQEEYDALPPGTHYRDSQGNTGVKGGSTASAPSGGFL